MHSVHPQQLQELFIHFVPGVKSDVHREHITAVLCFIKIHEQELLELRNKRF